MVANVNTESQIIAEIAAHLDKEGSVHGSWYVGISADPRRRLFNDHNVSEKGGWWIFRRAANDTIARRIEQHFLDLGCDGGGGGGDHTCCSVYAYRKTATTIE